MNILDFPVELLDAIFAQLLIAIGIRRAVFLRPVCQQFNRAILDAMCVAQVVDIHDPDTPLLESGLGLSLRSKIWAKKAQCPGQHYRAHVFVISRVVAELETLAAGIDVDRTRCWFETVAEGLSRWACYARYPDCWREETQKLHLLCGVVLLGDERLFEKLTRTCNSLGRVVNDKPEFFDSPLTLAASRGNINFVRSLLELGASLEAEVSRRKHPEETPFWRKGTRGDVQADFDLQDSYIQNLAIGERRQPTAMLAAIRGGHGVLLELLLRPKYRLPLTSLEYFLALVVAAEVGRADLIDTLFSTLGKSFTDVANLSTYMLCAAARGGHTSLVQRLLDSGVEINGMDGITKWEIGRSPGTMWQAATEGNITMLRFLLERGALASFPKSYGAVPKPIEAAAHGGKIEAVHLLLDYGAELIPAIKKASQQRQLPLIISLLHRYPALLKQDDWELGRRALQIAIHSRGRRDIIDFLAQIGVPLNSGYRKTFGVPLNIAKGTSSVPLSMIEHLISLGAEQTEEEIVPREPQQDNYGIVITERTREWTGPF